MSHFLKQKVETFSSLSSLKTALEQVAKTKSAVEDAGTVYIYGRQQQQADIVCRGRGFGMSRDFGYRQEGNEVMCVCDSMDRHRINNVEQQAKQHYISNEVKQELQRLGFSQQNQTVGQQQQIQLTFTRWR